MSRAFVKEGDGDEALARPEPALPPGVPNHVTPEGAARFSARRAEAERARAELGDSGVDRARRAELDAEIRWLDRRIATFVVTPPAPNPVRVGFGARVAVPYGPVQSRVVASRQRRTEPAFADRCGRTVCAFGLTCALALGRGGERRVHIVGVDEVDPAAGAVSWRSPVALALQGAEPGDVVVVDTPSGPEELEVVALG